MTVELLFCGFGAQADLLRGGFADVGLLHGGQGLTGLDTEDLLVERQSAVLLSVHRLAGRAEVTLADLEGEPLARVPDLLQDAFRGEAGPKVGVAVRGRRGLRFGMPGSCCS